LDIIRSTNRAREGKANNQSEVAEERRGEERRGEGGREGGKGESRHGG